LPKSFQSRQDALPSIFRELKALLQPYCPPLVERGVTTAKLQYHLWSIKDIEIAGRNRKAVYFAGIIIQKGYVGFYYMPAYTNAELKKFFPPELLRLLKGKSCFHIKELSLKLLRQIRQALRLGFRQYNTRCWI